MWRLKEDKNYVTKVCLDLILFYLYLPYLMQRTFLWVQSSYLLHGSFTSCFQEEKELSGCVAFAAFSMSSAQNHLCAVVILWVAACS